MNHPTGRRPYSGPGVWGDLREGREPVWFRVVQRNIAEERSNKKQPGFLLLRAVRLVLSQSGNRSRKLPSFGKKDGVVRGVANTGIAVSVNVRTPDAS